MITMQELNNIYIDKLLQTGSHDAALLKIAWVAYKQGIKDATPLNGTPEDVDMSTTFVV